MRRVLYALARFLGDLKTLRRGRIFPRLFKAVGRQLWRVWR